MEPNCSHSNLISDTDESYLNTSSSNKSIDYISIQNSHSREDDRIMCSNSRSLDKILQTISTNVDKFVDTLELGAEKDQFVSRVFEIVKDSIQEHVTINGLPYCTNKEKCSADEKEEQKLETESALLTELSKKLQYTASNRKLCPRNYCKILEKRLKYERLNIKDAKISHSVKLPLLKKQSLKIHPVPPEKLEEVKEGLKASETKISESLSELKRIQRNMKIAENILSQPLHSEFCDTGYDSS